MKPKKTSIPLFFIFGLLCLNFMVLGQQKTALLIGNADYAGSSLRNPVNDATDLAAALRGIGFDVTLQTNRNLQQMEADIRAFGQKISSSGVALFYFSGHGTQVDGINYLIPVGQEIYAADEIRYKCVAADMPLAKMETAGSHMNILILDACRNNPFKGFRSQERGFAFMQAPTGTFISYATAPGSVAFDGNGRNSPYTANLVTILKTPGMKIEEVFKKVREKVMSETENKQVPWESSSLVGEFYFTPGTPVNNQNSAVNQNSYTPATPINEKTRNSYEPEMVFVKGGTFTMGSNDGSDDEKPTHQVTVSDFYIGKFEVTVALFKNFIDETTYQTDADKGDGSYILTNGKWEKKSGINWRCDVEGNIGTASEQNHPVIHVSWNDATEFCKWLSRKTGKSYRLPTEAEWEFTAGNGSKHTKYSWGNGNPFGKNGGNIADETARQKFNDWAIFSGYSDGYVFSAPVGSFNPNDLGIYDMTGNVWEWCSDWYAADYYKNSPAYNPKGPASGDYRIVRGGSWIDGPNDDRIAYRYWLNPGYCYFFIGFRLVQDY